MGVNICNICEGIDPNLSNVENGARLGVSEATIRRHRAAPHTDPFFTDIPVDIITSRGRTVRLPDGSYEKITYSPAKYAVMEAVKYDDLAHLIDAPASVPTHRTRPHAAVLNVADLQIGKGKQRGGGTEDTIRRAKESVAKFIEHVKETVPQTIVIVDNGDAMEGIFSGGGGQAYTNDRTLLEQFRIVRHLFAWIIREVAPHAPEIVVVAVPSNHGEVRAAHHIRAGSIDDDFGLEINLILEEQFADWKHVQFVRPEPLYGTAVVEAAGTKLAFNHGHHTKGGQNNHDKWWAAQDHGRMPGWDADILVVAHYHNMRVEQSGDGRWIISCSAGETSSDWFTDSHGQQAKRGLTGFDVRDGEWFNLRIY